MAGNMWTNNTQYSRCVRLEAVLCRMTSKYRESDKRADGSLSFWIALAILWCHSLIILRSAASSRTHLLSLCVCNLYSPPDWKQVESDNKFLGRGSLGNGVWGGVAKIWDGVPSRDLHGRDSAVIGCFSICVLQRSCVLVFLFYVIIDRRSSVPILKNASTEDAWKCPDVFLISKMYPVQTWENRVVINPRRRCRCRCTEACKL